MPIEYPQPLSGSYEALNLEQTWMTADSRYGPYGYGEADPEYNRSKVDWKRMDWGELQNDCLSLNSHRFGDAANFTSKRQMTYYASDSTHLLSTQRHKKYPFEKTGRTAIVFRTWDSYNYVEKDFHHLRAVITEAALGSQGDYTVVLLVHVKDRDKRIFEGQDGYQSILNNMPQELRSMAVLFDDNLLESWYPKVEEHS